MVPQGRKAADGRKPRHGRGDRKRERSFSGLSLLLNLTTGALILILIYGLLPVSEDHNAKGPWQLRMKLPAFRIKEAA